MTIDVTAFNAAAAAGDKALSSGLSTTAVQSYQQAGQLGASVIGPAIDAAGGNTQQYTHAAWVTNGTLAALNAADATASDAANAQKLVAQMLAQYKLAIAAMPGATATTAPASSVPTFPLIGGAAGILVGLGLFAGIVPSLAMGAIGAGIGWYMSKKVTP